MRFGAVAALAATPLLAALAATLLCAATPALADDKEGLLASALNLPDGWTINGTVHARIEYLAGQFRPAPAPADDQFLALHSSLFVEHREGPVRFGAEVIDARVYLENPHSSVSNNDVNALELSQAYIGLDLSGGADGAKSHGALTLGRFTMDVGSRRIVARNQFRNAINAFTGARLDWHWASGDRLQLFWTLPQLRLPNDTDGLVSNRIQWDRESLAVQFFGADFTKARLVAGANAEIYAFGLLEEDRPGFPTRNRRLATFGTRINRSPQKGAFDFDVEGVYQLGHAHVSAADTDLRDLPVAAGFVHAEVGRTFAAPWRPRIALIYDFASGDGPNPNRYTRFDTLFGARRVEYAPTSLFGVIARGNLSAPLVRVELAPSSKVELSFNWRSLSLASGTDSFPGTGVRDATGRSGRFAGNLVDTRGRFWIVPGVLRADLGIAWLDKGRFLRDAPNAPDTGDSQYGYGEIDFSF